MTLLGDTKALIALRFSLKIPRSTSAQVGRWSKVLRMESSLGDIVSGYGFHWFLGSPFTSVSTIAAVTNYPLNTYLHKELIIFLL
jgi:hypothetical protein